MLIDDETILIKYACGFLERLGYRVTVFQGGETMLKASSEQPEGFDLVVAGITIPGLTGDRVTRELL